MIDAPLLRRDHVAETHLPVAHRMTPFATRPAISIAHEADLKPLAADVLTDRWSPVPASAQLNSAETWWRIDPDQ